MKKLEKLALLVPLAIGGTIALAKQAGRAYEFYQTWTEYKARVKEIDRMRYSGM